MLLVGASCGGKAGDEDPIQSQTAPTGGDLEPHHPRTANAPTSSSSPPPADGAPTVTPEGMPNAENGASRRTRYINALRSADDILERYCGACHGKAVPTAPCGLRFDDTDDAVALGLLIPLSAEESSLTRVILDGSMPPPGAQPRPGAAELDQLRAFIDNPEFWSTLPPDGHSMADAYFDAENNACDATPEAAADAGAAADSG